MTPNERGQQNLDNMKMGSDAKIDALLKEFFANEMPAELRQLAEGVQTDAQHPGRPQHVAVSAEAVGGHQRRAGWLGVSVVAASLLTIAVLLSQPIAPTADVADSAANPAAPASSVSSTESTKPEVKVSATEDFNDVERYDTTIGPVEQRSKLRIKNVTIFDPETGAAIELLPELEIDIFPIEDE